MAAIYVLAVVLVLLTIHSAAVIVAAVITAHKSRKDSPCDVLIILGSRVDGDAPTPDLTARITAAAEYMKSHPDSVAIGTGGCFRQGQKLSEAQVIYNGLSALGNSPERIFVEDKARTTYENFKNSSMIITQELNGSKNIGILSNTYHLFRAGLIARDSGVSDFVLIPAPSPTPVKGYVRESVVIFEVWMKRVKRAFTAHRKQKKG